MSKYLVGIDAGHSLVTPGKCTPPILSDLMDKQGKVLKKKGDTIREYEFNKKVAYALGDALKRCNIGVCYSGFKDNTDVALSKRASLLNSNKVDLVISCHYNASGNCLKFQTRIKGLLVLRTKNCSEKAITLGNKVHAELKDALKPEKDYGLMRDVDMSGCTLAILRQTNAPAILIEYGFMDYWNEAKNMLNEDYIEKCAEATAKGVCNYLGVMYVPKKDVTEKLPKYVKVIKAVNFRSKPSWEDDAVIKELEVGTALTVLDKVKVGSSYMYKTPYGYITANETWVQPMY